MRKRKANRWQAGFTLIELVAVVGILLVLIVALLPRLEADRRSSNDTVVQSYLREVQKYQEMYYGFNRRYAQELADLRALVPPLENPPANPPVEVEFITTDVDYNREYCVLASTNVGQYWYQATSKGVRARTTHPATGPAPTSCDFTLY